MSDLSKKAVAARVFKDRDELDRELARTVSRSLDQAIEERGRAILVVSGGSTPLHFFQLLSHKELDWLRVSVILADERWVPPDHRDSNEKLVRDNLLVNAAAQAQFIPLKRNQADAVAAEGEVDAILSRLGTFDVVILGMGEDGHTASLFPDSTALDRGLELTSGRQCLAVTSLSAPHQRMSLTLPRLLDSRQIIVHITGASKKAVLDQACEQNNPRQWPIVAVLKQTRTPVTLYYSP